MKRLREDESWRGDASEAALTACGKRPNKNPGGMHKTKVIPGGVPQMWQKMDDNVQPRATLRSRAGGVGFDRQTQKFNPDKDLNLDQTSGCQSRPLLQEHLCHVNHFPCLRTSQRGLR